MKEDKEEITTEIKYYDGMEMKDLVDAINNSNAAMMTAFTATIQNQSNLILGEMNRRFDGVNSRIDEVSSRIDGVSRGYTSINQNLDSIKRHLGIVD